MTIPCEAVPELKWHLSVGIAIGVLGFIGVVVPLVRDGQWKRWEKNEKPWRKWEVAGWTAFCFVLLIFEMYSIGKLEEHQRLQQVYDTCVQQNRFEETVGKLDKSISTAKDSFDTAKKAVVAATNSFTQGKQAVDLLTGGTSFPYIDFDSPYHETAVAKKVGKFPRLDGPLRNRGLRQHGYLGRLQVRSRLGN